MVDKTACRTGEVLRRVKKIRRGQENYFLLGLAGFCLTLLGGVFAIIGKVVHAMPQSDIIIGTYGTVLLHSGASAYVLVGLLAFVAGVVSTALCLRAQHNRATTDHNQEEATK